MTAAGAPRPIGRGAPDIYDRNGVERNLAVARGCTTRGVNPTVKGILGYKLLRISCFWYDKAGLDDRPTFYSLQRRSQTRKYGTGLSRRTRGCDIE